MALKTMYPPQANSPATYLTEAVAADATSIKVNSASVLPALPTLLVLGSEEKAAECVLATSKSSNTITVERAVEGTAKAWPAGTSVARLFTAEDLRAVQENLGILIRGKIALSDIGRQTADVSLWAHGPISSTTGDNQTPTSTNPRMRTRTYLDSDVKSVKPASGYKIAVYVYNASGVFQGIWNGTSLGTGSSAVVFFEDEVILPYTELGYKYRIMASDINNSALDTEEKQALVAGSVYLSSYTDTTMSIPGMAADAGAVGELFDATLTYRRTLTSGDDMDAVDLPGTYYYSTKSGGGGAPDHAPAVNNHRFRVVVIKPAAAGNYIGGVQIVWSDNGEMKYRVYDGSDVSGSWEENWHTIATAEDVNNKLDVLTEAAFEQLDTTDFSHSFGGTTAKGDRNNMTTRLIIKDAKTNLTAYYVKAGSSVTVAEGYKFSATLYSEYKGSSKYTFISQRSITEGGGTYVVPQDCWLRVTIGKNDDAALWEVDNDGQQVLTAAGILALGAVTLNLFGDSVSESVRELRNSINQLDTDNEDAPRPLLGGIPVNAIEYHKQWDDLCEDPFASNSANIDSKICTRSAATYLPGDAGHKWPLYTYTIESHTQHMNPNYARTTRNVTTYPQLKRPNVLIVSGIHGSERGTPNFLVDFVHTMCSESKYAALLTKYDWTFVPLANPWGYSHSYVTAGGTVFHGMSWSPNNYPDLVENTVENGYNGGVRHTSVGIDLNRTFTETNYTYVDTHGGYTSQHSTDKETTVGGNPETDWTEKAPGAATGGVGWLPEAQYLRQVLRSKKFDIVIDLHQAGGVDSNLISGFVSFSGTEIPSQQSMALKPLWDTVVQAGAASEAALSAKYGVPFGGQTFLPWETMAGYTFRAYAGGGNGNIGSQDYAAKYALVLETSCNARFYSKLKTNSTWQNDIANDVGNTFLHNFLRRFLEEVEA